MRIRLLVVAGLFALAPSLRAQDAGETKAEAPQPPAFSVEDFVRYLRGRRASGEILAAFERDWKAGPDARITDRALRAVDPRYRTAVEAAEAGEPRAALLLAKLVAGGDPYVRAHARFHLARVLLDEDDPEGAASLFAEFVREDRGRSLLDAEAAFFLGYSFALIPDAARAIANLRAFLKLYPEAPERYRANAQQLLAELEAQWDSPLHAIADEMKYCERKLRKEQIGREVETKQLDIVDKLTKLIEQLEQQQQQQGGGPPQGNGPSAGPAGSSQLNPGQGRVGALHGSRGVKDKWGDLKDRDREKILNEIQTKLPERYRVLLEDYYKKINRARR